MVVGTPEVVTAVVVEVVATAVVDVVAETEDAAVEVTELVVEEAGRVGGVDDAARLEQPAARLAQTNAENRKRKAVFLSMLGLYRRRLE